MDIPCMDCTEECGIRNELLKVYRLSSPSAHADPDFEALTTTLMETLSVLVSNGHIANSADLGKALAAIFDLCVSLEYAKYVTDTDWLYCPTNDPNYEPVLFYPYMKTCPRCASQQKLAWTGAGGKAHKPGSDKIGSIAAKTIGSMLSSLSHRTRSGWLVLQTTRQVYDIDLIIYNETFLTLCEIKASPLIAYPLAVTLKREMRRQGENDEQETIGSHKESDLPISNVDRLYLYIPYIHKFLDLGDPNHNAYPVKTFLMLYADKPDIVLELIRLWSQLYEGYLRNWTGPSDKQLRYLTFGCGGNIDDSKNNPGIDRTDDIKKGIYQMLKLGEHFSAKCKRGQIQIALLSNIHAVRHHRDYLSGFEELTWTYERCLEPTDDSDWRKVRVDDLINLYDAFIALTQPQFREQAFTEGFSLEYLLSKL